MLFVPCVNSPLIASRATLYFSDGLNLLFLLIHRLLRFGENYILFFTFFGPNLPHHYISSRTIANSLRKLTNSASDGLI